MRETGVVTEIKGKTAIVKVDKKSECDKCGMCLFPKGADGITFNANNEVNAKIGDTVVIEREKDGKLLGAILVFLIPLILIGLASVLAYTIIKKEIFVLILSVVFIAVWYMVLAIIDKNLNKRIGYSTKIVSIVKKAEELSEE